MIRGITLFLFAGIFSQLAQADLVRNEFPIKREPIKLCAPSPDREVQSAVESALASAQTSLKCGDYQKAYEEILVALEGVEYLQAAARGYCYSKPNCKGAKVSSQLVTQSQCKATGIGESWHPFPSGTCVNL